MEDDLHPDELRARPGRLKFSCLVACCATLMMSTTASLWMSKLSGVGRVHPRLLLSTMLGRQPAADRYLGSAGRLARRNVPGDMLGVSSDPADQH